MLSLIHISFTYVSASADKGTVTGTTSEVATTYEITRDSAVSYTHLTIKKVLRYQGFWGKKLMEAILMRAGSFMAVIILGYVLKKVVETRVPAGAVLGR